MGSSEYERVNSYSLSMKLNWYKDQSLYAIIDKILWTRIFAAFVPKCMVLIACPSKLISSTPPSQMDAASVVLSEGLDPTMPRTYAALSYFSNVPASTLWHRAHGRPSRDEKAKCQQYLTPSEEKALVNYALRLSITWTKQELYYACLTLLKSL